MPLVVARVAGDRLSLPDFFWGEGDVCVSETCPEAKVLYTKV